MNNKKIKRVGRSGQTWIYLGKLFRMFIYQNDWKVLPMAAIIAYLVSTVVAKNMFLSMEGTQIGAFAITCICIWNGCFNSIQVICRERPIVKREHRSGLHITSYISAHMIYQAFLCLCQTGITIVVLRYAKVQFPAESFVSGSVTVDLFITIFLVSYAANMISLFVSSIVRSTTTAMTFMPFFLIFQLIFSGGFFELSGNLETVSEYTVSRCGLNALCAQGNFNNLKMSSSWTALYKLRNLEVTDEQMAMLTNIMLEANGVNDVKVKGDLVVYGPDEIALYQISAENKTRKPVGVIVDYVESEPGMKEDLMLKCGEQNYNVNYESSTVNVIACWINLIVMIIFFHIAAVISLEFIDRDRR
ncbi:MAG: ABC transporter permease [Oscillospiraceae bacterium]|nr:ABC transporter permease [Oscillospiraceae bacterium]